MSQAIPEFDLIVVGGGINGAGIARDAAERGLHVLLLERDDFGSGTSSWSSRLIHGGLRYLEYAEFPLVFESLRERRLLQRMAPHLVHRLPITIPVYKSARRGLFLIRLGLIAYDILSIGKVVPRHRMLSREAIMESLPGLNSDELTGGARYFDAQVEYPERLVLENVIAAAEAGAEVRNHSPVVGMSIDDSKVDNVRYVDPASGNEQVVSARVIINAGGPWVDRILATANCNEPDQMGGTKGSHIIVRRFEGEPGNAIYAETEADGRPFFIIPWNDQILIGTTDLRYDGDPAEVSASEEEIDYLLTETNRLFPRAKLRKSDIHYAYAGVRPLPKQTAGPESAITRKHIIKRHQPLASNLISIIGGKLTTYRNLSEQAVDLAASLIHRKSGECRTRTTPLPGGTLMDDARSALESFGLLSKEARKRLLRIYGGRATDILDIANRRADCRVLLDGDSRILAAEVVHAIECEFAVTLVDILHRRLMIGLDADQGKGAIDAIAKIAARELDWNSETRLQQVRNLEDYQRRFQPA